MLNQPRHVVYHSHYAGIFNSHGSDNPNCSHSVVRSEVIRCRNQRTISHRACAMLATDHNVYVVKAAVVRHTLVENLDQTGLFLKGPEKMTHSFDIHKVRFV